MRVAPFALLLLLTACQEKPAPPLSSLKPPPLPAVQAVGAPDASADAREAVFQIAPYEVFGDEAPSKADELFFSNGEAKREQSGQNPKLLTFDDETYLAQISERLAALDDSDAEVWFKHPHKDVAFRVKLMDEAAFQQWLTEPVPGQLRIVQRSDGLELTTNMGKLPGFDPNGPSIPVRGGKLDIPTLRASLEKLKQRFGSKAKQVCLLPSFGTELWKITEVMSGTFRANGDAIYEELCLVYPRPSAPKK
jgi:hypothetical protein